MRKFRIGMIGFAVLIIIIYIISIDFTNLSWAENTEAYGMIIAFCILIAGLIYSILHDKKKDKTHNEN